MLERIKIAQYFQQWSFQKWVLLIFVMFSFNFLYSQDQKLGAEDLFSLAKQEGENLNFEKAAKYCEIALKQTPLDMDIKEYLGKCYMELGRLEEARIVLLDVLRQSPKRVDARHYLLNIETQTERYSSAVCYANELLEITPYAKTLWMRKITLYQLMNNRIEAERATKRLYHIFPEDEEVRAMYNNLLKEEALRASKNQDMKEAIKQYENALVATMDDEELYLSLINAYIKIGNYDMALETANKGLFYLPESEAIFKKKVGVLEQKQDYNRAIDAVKMKLATNPSPEYTMLLNYLLSESARYHRNSDPYELYGQLYSRDRTNREAYNYLLNTALARGYYGAAQDLLTEGLRSNPNSKELLSKQLYLYELQQNKEGERATLVKLYRLYPGDDDIAYKYELYQYKQAKLDLEQKNYRSALPVFLALQNHPDYGVSAKQSLFSIYMAQSNYDEALDIATELMETYPDDPSYVMRKIDAYAAKEDFDTAYEMALYYEENYPEKPIYGDVVDELSIQYIQYLQEDEQFEKMAEVADYQVSKNSRNRLAYSYAISARLQQKKYEEAMDVAESALVYFPNDREFRLKLAGIYSQAGQRDDALAMLSELREDYPYNSQIKGAYIEELYKKGKELEEDDDIREAKKSYYEILSIKPSDSLAPMRLTNLYLAEDSLYNAMKMVDTALYYHPSHNEFIFKKGVVYEKMEEYELALEYYKMYIPTCNRVDEHRDLIDYIASLLLKNQIIISYLNARTDSIPLMTSVASIEYNRFVGKNIFGARLNYAARATAIGLQLEADWYRELRNNSSFLASAGIANRFFPRFKASFSFYEPINNDWTAELGLKYFNFFGGRNLWMGTIGAEKTFNDVWFNLRVNIATDWQNFYNNVLAQSRFYLRNGRNYILAQASVGTIPEVENIDFQVNTFLSYINTMVGAGYFHHFSHRTSAGIMGNWYSFRLLEDRITNMYNVFVTVRHKF